MTADSNELRAGVVYPLPARLLSGGWLRSRWEDAAAGPALMPTRRLYRLGAGHGAEVRQVLADTGRPVARQAWGLSGGAA